MARRHDDWQAANEKPQSVCNVDNEANDERHYDDITTRLRTHHTAHATQA